MLIRNRSISLLHLMPLGNGNMFPDQVVVTPPSPSSTSYSPACNAQKHLSSEGVGTSRPGVPLEDYFKLLHLKIQSYEQLKNWKTNQVNPCAHMVANLVSKQDPKISRNSRISWENWDFPSPKLQFSSHKIWFSSTAFQFPRNPWKSSSTAVQFLQWLSSFFNGFPLSKKYEKTFLDGFSISSMAFRFLQRLSANKLFVSWIICSAN
jgi:hypothetical protein